jgi:adenine phosphoribosyltransferase
MIDEFLLKSHVQRVENWPHEGMDSLDITPLFRNPVTTRMITDAMTQRYLEQDISHIVALDAGGFLLGSNLSYVLNLPLVLIRKPGKLPPPVESLEFASGQSTDILEIQKDALVEDARVLVVDDLIATGSTVLAATQLVQRSGASVIEVAAIIALSNSGGLERLSDTGIANYSLLMLD